MRKLRVFESISIDGYFADADGDIGWAHSGREDVEFAEWVGANASKGGALLFGRKTYQMMEAFWPTPIAAQQMPEVAKGMNAAKKFVASRTIKPTWNNSLLLGTDLVKSMRDIKAGDGPDITVLGSGSVAAQLGEARLVDEYQFVIIPVALGEGRTIFTKIAKLHLLEQRAFRGGNVVVTYAAQD
jgi:dihydrofolate reductase